MVQAITSHNISFYVLTYLLFQNILALVLVRHVEYEAVYHRLNMHGVRSPKFIWLHVHTAQLYSLAEAPQLAPSPGIWAHIRGRYWSRTQDRRHLFLTPCIVYTKRLWEHAEI
jgi:hypothetical protein